MTARLSRKVGRLVGLFIVAAMLASACSFEKDDQSAGDPENGGSTTTSTSPFVTPEVAGSIDLGDIDTTEGCDFLQKRHCLLPFPSDSYTVESGRNDTGRAVFFRQAQMPANLDGRRIDPTEWNRSDGFSPGSPILAYIPQVALDRSEAPTITDIERSLDPESPTVIIDAETGERVPHWAEIDAKATSDLSRLTILRPAVNLEEGRRYIVALRNLRGFNGESLPPDDVFAAYRDSLGTGIPAVEARRDDMETIFRELNDAGIPRGDLWLAWDFTVASERNLSERLLTIRDDAFEALGDAAPAFEVTGVSTDVGDAAGEVAYYVDGTFEVPLYLTGDGGPGQGFNWSDDLPVRNEATPTYTANFTCTVPRAATADGAAPARPVVYGHGLLGDRTEVRARNIQLMTSEYNMVYCATDWIGMSEQDVPNAVTILGDLSTFNTLADRSQQGILNTLFLGRLMKHDGGLVSNEAFQRNGEPIINTDDLFFDGNSQGAIMGGAATAVALDWERAVLGVTGMNYSTLLNRSVDFDLYLTILEAAYQDEVDRALLYPLMQMLWDRAETNGYARHLTDDPLPGTPEHKVLLHVAFGDFQVADVAGFVEARTVGARYYAPLLGPDRGLIDYAWGLEPLEDGWDGSAVVMWDSGVPAPPLDNTPPTGVGDPQGPYDPHEDPRMTPAARQQKSAFLTTDGVVIDVCGGGPCLADRAG